MLFLIRQKMLYCDKCEKEVVIVGEGSSAGMDEDLESWEEELKEKGKIILYSPPKSPELFCPECGSKLREKTQD
jgi:hypothetical protein